jgi:hypothetical protein
MDINNLRDKFKAQRASLGELGEIGFFWFPDFPYTHFSAVENRWSHVSDVLTKGASQLDSCDL